MAKFTNISGGDRGIYSANGLVMVAPGQAFEGELAEGETPSPEWFVEGDAPTPAKATEDNTQLLADLEAANERADKAVADLEAADAKIAELEELLKVADAESNSKAAADKAKGDQTK